MKGLLTTLFCTLIWSQVSSYYITIESLMSKEGSPITVKQSDLYNSKEFDYEVRNYTIVWGDSITSENDVPVCKKNESHKMTYYFDDGGDVVGEGSTTLCSADLSTEEGTVAVLIAKALGIQNDEVCPTESGEMNQISVFQLDGGNFGELINNDDPDDDDDSTDLTCTISIGAYIKATLGIMKDSDWSEPDPEDDPDKNSTALHLKDFADDDENNGDDNDDDDDNGEDGGDEDGDDDDDRDE